MANTSVFGRTKIMVLITIFLSSFHFTALSFRNFTQLPLPQGGMFPEALAFDSMGRGPYTGIADGRIVVYRGPNIGFQDFAFDTPRRSKALCDGKSLLGLICGRPVGIGFYNSTGELYIADGALGQLLVVGPNGGLASPLATSAEGLRFRFLNGLDVDPITGLVYFTDFSFIFGISGVHAAVFLNDATGRLLRYDPKTRTVTVLRRQLSGPAGVAVSPDGAYLLFTEYIGGRITKYWLKGPRANTSYVAITFPRGTKPDNIKRAPSGDYWVAVNVQQPLSAVNNPTAVKINPCGQVLANVSLVGQYGNNMISEVQEFGDSYYIGSMTTNFVGVYKK